MRDRLCFEDFPPGDVHELGEAVTSEEEIVDFAEEWDPQYFHTDPVRSLEGPFGGGVVASGWQICAAWMRLWVDAVLGRTAVCGLAQAEDIRWFAPWRPGEQLRARAVVLEPTEPAAGDRGVVSVEAQMLAADGTLAARMIVRTPVSRRAS